MKKILMIICMVTSINVQAQIQTDTIGRGDLATLFQNLSAANIPTGYLMEWGTEMTDKDDLNGLITDSNFVNKSILYAWFTLIFTVQSLRLMPKTCFRQIHLTI